MGKKDYVLMNAKKGDMGALENVVGGMMAPLWDLAVLYLDDAETAKPMIHDSLSLLAAKILNDDLGDQTPALFVGKDFLSRLREEAAPTDSFSSMLKDMVAEDRLLYLAHRCLEMPEEATCAVLHRTIDDLSNVVATLEQAKNQTADVWRERLDEQAATFQLPEGIVDRIITALEDSIEDEEA